MTPLRFDSPEYLLLLAVLVWIWRTGRGAHGRAVVVRCAIAALLVLAAAGLETRSGSAPASLFFVLDRSESMTEVYGDPLPRVNAIAAAMTPSDRAGLVAFGADAAVERALGEALTVTRIDSAMNGTGTDIARAIRTARAALPPEGDRRLVLVSDGRQTGGDALREARLAAADGIRIDVLEPSGAPAAGRQFRVTRLTAPPVVRMGEPYLLTAVVEGPPGSSATLIVRSDGRTLARDIVIGLDGLATVTLDERHAGAGTYPYEAAAHARDDMLPDLGEAGTSAGTVVVVSGEPRVLYVGRTPQLLRPALLASGFRVDVDATLPPAAQLAPALGTYDAVVLDDVPAGELEAAQSAALSRYVETAGGGLLVLGGPGSLDPGMPAESPMAQLLPIDLRPRAGRRGPGVALLVVFDKSGSMDDRVGGAQKIELARQAVQRALESMPSTDALGVIAFDSEAMPVLPLAPLSSSEDLRARLRAVSPNGATAMAPALELARAWLSDPAVAGLRRHVLLVSDGRTSPADAARAEEALRDQEIEVTAIALGAESDRALLARLAASTGGRAFFPDDARDLPSILAREAVRVSGGGTVEEPFTPRADAHPLLAGIDREALPRLGGYVVSAVKPAAQAVLRSHLDDPVLATWHVGLGKVAVYTSALHSDWSSAFRAWRGFEPLAAQTVRWLARRAHDDNLHVSVDEEDGRARVVVEATDEENGLRMGLAVRASLRMPSGGMLDLDLRESAPGRYEADAALPAAGPYTLAAEVTSPDRQYSSSVARGFYWQASREHEEPGVDRETLSAVAALTGGTILGPDDNPFTLARTPTYRDVRAWLLTLALALFLGQVLNRQVFHVLAPARRAAMALLSRSSDAAGRSSSSGAGA